MLRNRVAPLGMSKQDALAEDKKGSVYVEELLCFYLCVGGRPSMVSVGA